ncbi:MAG: ATP-binding protein [Dehalococcoidales bacterium]|nr:ATP-binding protein [Dehalococcoidales bacterium]
MAILFRGKKLSELVLEDLQRLIDDQVQERDTIEYKRDMYGSSDDEKREMLKDISSMANNLGGYILIGIDANGEGIPTTLVGVEKGNHVERISNCCLDNIDKRIIGLDIEDIDLGDGNNVIIISIPESTNAPHMVTYKGINQFWKRHGRLKEKMTVDEIAGAFDRKLSNLNSIDRFRFVRRSEILEAIGNKTYMIVSVSPTNLLFNETILDIHDEQLRQLITSIPPFYGQQISCGKPYPTIRGLRADLSTPYWNDINDHGEFLEVFRNGYIEYGKHIRHEGEEGTFIASLVEIPLIVAFIKFIQGIYEQYLPIAPLMASLSIFNANNMWLAVHNHGDGTVKWHGQHLELGQFFFENTSEERKLVAKRICDRLWQAFNREKCNLFDDAGTFRVPR